MQVERRGLFKGVNRRMSILSIIMMVVVALSAMLFPKLMAGHIDGLRQFFNPFLEWYYVIIFGFMLFFMIWLGLGRYQRVRLGGDLEEPEFTFFSWISMLFAAGTGVGILFWAVAQPVMQFEYNPFTESAMTPEAATTAISLAFFHWGLNGWAMFAFVALCLAYFAYRHDYPLTIRSALVPILGKRANGIIGDLVDVIAAFATIFGIATTLGVGMDQMSSGIVNTTGFEMSEGLQLAVVGIIMFIATASVVSGLEKGVRILSEVNIWISIVAVLFLLLFGPTQYLIGVTVESAGSYIQNLLRLTFHTNVTHQNDWQREWTVFFWGWWLAWSPFVGMFIARISRGRTLGEFVAGVILTPTVITIIWIGLFGGNALYQQLFGGFDMVGAVNKDVGSALFVMLKNIDTYAVIIDIISYLMLILIATFLITSANAGTLVVTTILSSGSVSPPSPHRVLWGVMLALLTGALLIAGGVDILQSAVVNAALPFSVVILLMMAGLIKSLSQERTVERSGQSRERPHEPWVLEEKTGEEPELKHELRVSDHEGR